MDLAGIGALGDAASHASMIMQSRQAKLQRWRPNSAGKQVSWVFETATLADARLGKKSYCHLLSIARRRQVRLRCSPDPGWIDRTNGAFTMGRASRLHHRRARTFRHSHRLCTSWAE